MGFRLDWLHARRVGPRPFRGRASEVRNGESGHRTALIRDSLRRLLQFFPVSHGAGDDAEQRVRFRPGDAPELSRKLRRSPPELGLEMTPLVAQLPGRFGNPPGGPSGWNFRGVEAIPTAFRLGGQPGQKRGDGARRIGLRLKAGKLRVAAVAPAGATQNCLGQQRLAPGGDQPLRVEVLGMHSPEAHGKNMAVPVRTSKLRGPPGCARVAGAHVSGTTALPPLCEPAGLVVRSGCARAAVETTLQRTVSAD